MSERIVYVSRIARLPLVGADGSDVGHVVDVVLDLGGRPPRVVGFVVGGVQRRRVFVAVTRISEIGTRGLRLRRGSINLRQFELRPGERLIMGELLGKQVGERRVVDIGLRPAPEPFEWEVATVALRVRRMPGLKRTPEVIDWSEAGELFAEERPVDRQAATLGGLHPAEMASAVRRLPLSRRRLLAEALEDDRLADLLEELPEDEQIRLIEGLDPVRVGRVLDEMEADDAADLLGEMSAAEQAELLARMDPEEAEPVRRLLNYQPDTAGGLMTPEPIILAPNNTVADALARVRDPDLSVPMAAQVFVCQPPLETPTGRFQGVVGFQRLLREAASKPLGRCIDEEWAAVPADTSDRDVAARLAAYDVVAIPVTDEAGRLVGAVTIDDVLDRVLPAGWRLTHTRG
ncbi:MAG TPA: CBS domain-containing protein [Solirubrobacteraceae bacterium]|jgi:CBS domain-containing protein/sporulation protein YlmC with PRC-barrel domain|nr:CBS domain-containing protein [Solirubrobacteraceae bacterium]